jgi:hypothetical protein
VLPEKRQIVLPPPKLLSTPELEQVHEVADLVGQWCEAVSSELKERLERGEPGQRFKLVAGRASRSWADEAVALDQLKQVIDPWETKMVSPAGAEKRCKAANIDPKLALNGLVKEERGKSMVPVADKRPALELTAPFTPVTT